MLWTNVVHCQSKTTHIHSSEFLDTSKKSRWLTEVLCICKHGFAWSHKHHLLPWISESSQQHEPWTQKGTECSNWMKNCPCKEFTRDKFEVTGGVEGNSAYIRRSGRRFRTNIYPTRTDLYRWHVLIIFQIRPREDLHIMENTRVTEIEERATWPGISGHMFRIQRSIYPSTLR